MPVSATRSVWPWAILAKLSMPTFVAMDTVARLAARDGAAAGAYERGERPTSMVGYDSELRRCNEVGGVTGSGEATSPTNLGKGGINNNNRPMQHQY